MEDTFGRMFKITDSNYSVWKSKMRDMLVVKDLWLLVQFGDQRPDKIDATTWEVMHMKTTAYIRCFIDMSLYNNFNEESQSHELWEKIGSSRNFATSLKKGSGMSLVRNAFADKEYLP